MKAVLTSIQPYYVFLIIARIMGWNIPQAKTIEVRKDFPKDPAWNRCVHIYCSKNKKSFKRIPKQFQSCMKKLLGKVIGEFVCDSIRKGRADNAIAAYFHNDPEETCLTDRELVLYANLEKPLYFWHISDLKIYDKPKELGEFYKVGKRKACIYGDKTCIYSRTTDFCKKCEFEIKSPPQSWRYVEGI